jgi:hypothetical protein
MFLIKYYNTRPSYARANAPSLVKPEKT